MLEAILGFMFMLGIGMVVVGLSEFFTTTFPDKWYPGMNYRWFTILPFLPLSDKAALKLVFYGMLLLSITAAASALLTEMKLISI